MSETGKLITKIIGSILLVVIVYLLFSYLAAAIISHTVYAFEIQDLAVPLVLGLVVQCIVSVPANVLIDPLYGVDASIVLGLAGWIVAFNVVKGSVNSVLTGVVYKSISNLITPKKDQVKGR